VDLNQVLRETEEFVKSRKEFRHVAFALDLSDGPLVVRATRSCSGRWRPPHRERLRGAARRGRGEAHHAPRGAARGRGVADRGPGIPEADRERVFEPFYSTRDSTGLGLSICHTIVRQHDGELEVVPREGGGSVFRMRLPMIEG